MKEIKNFVVLFVVATMVLFSCDKKDDDAASIVGKWQYAKEGTIVNGSEVLVDYNHTPGCSKDYIEVIDGGVLKDVYYDSNGAGGCDETIDTAAWTRNGNTLTVTAFGESSTVEISELTQTTLKVKYTDPSDGTMYVTVHTRI